MLMKRFSKSYSTVENDRVSKGKSQETGKKKNENITYVL